jgi:hypothetical protein
MMVPLFGGYIISPDGKEHYVVPEHLRPKWWDVTIVYMRSLWRSALRFLTNRQ